MYNIQYNAIPSDITKNIFSFTSIYPSISILSVSLKGRLQEPHSLVSLLKRIQIVFLKIDEGEEKNLNPEVIK